MKCKLHEDYNFCEIQATGRTIISEEYELPKTTYLCGMRHIKDMHVADWLTISWTKHGRFWRANLELRSLVSLTCISLVDKESIRK